MRPEALILDFGEVLTRSQPPELVERMAGLAGMTLDDFARRYWRHRLAYDQGLTGAQYWGKVLDAADGLPDELVARLVEADADSWSSYRPEVWDLAAAFRASGRRTAMLSNGVAEIIARIRAGRDLTRWFDIVVVSCEVGVCKPEAEIYRVCVERLGVPASQALFVDDRVENLRGAEAVGLQTLHFTGDASVEPLKRALGL